MQGNTLVKIILGITLLVGIFILGRGALYFDNDEVADQSLINAQVAQVNQAGETYEPTEAELPSRLLIPRLEWTPMSNDSV